VAERAIRYLRAAATPVTSVRLAREVLLLTVRDESRATAVLAEALGGDSRLHYADGSWQAIRAEAAHAPGDVDEAAEAETTFVLVEGSRPAPRAPMRLTAGAAARRRGREIVGACGGDLAPFSPGHDLKLEVLRLLAGARVVVHAPPGGLAALEAWLDEPLAAPLPLALLAHRRLGLPSAHGVADVAARLGLAVRVDDDPARRIEILPACFDALSAEGESWDELASSCRPRGPSLPWGRYAFGPADLAAIPATPGTYRFFDAEGGLLYVGKSRNLRRRLAGWFRDGVPRTARVQGIVDAVHRFEVAPAGSELEALLREAAQIRRLDPARNVQRQVHPGSRRERRLTSMLLIEPAEAPWVLRAWLIHDGALVDTVPLGPRGGGLARIARVLDRAFFDPRPGPVAARARAVDVEIVTRWLAEHRDRVVAFDPTHLRSTDEVVARLRWFLERGSLHDGEGAPILPRR